MKLKRFLLPLVVTAIALSLFVVWRLLDLPPEAEVIEIARRYFETYGVVTVFVSAIIESIILAGMYYPGSLVIFLGVIFSGKDVSDTALVVLVTIFGLTLGQTANFFAGKYGWHKLLMKLGMKDSLERAEAKLRANGAKIMFLTFWHPNFGAITSTAAGILSMPFRTFILFATLATSAWCTFWGTLAYFLGERALSLMGVRFLIIIIVIWLLLELWKKETPV